MNDTVVTYFWVVQARQRGWTDLDIFDFGWALEKLFPEASNVLAMMDEVLRPWTDGARSSFFATVLQILNDAQRRSRGNNSDRKSYI